MTWSGIPDLISQGDADIHHDRQADDLRRSFEISHWISHPQTLRNSPRRLKLVYSDTAYLGNVGLSASWFLSLEDARSKFEA